MIIKPLSSMLSLLAATTIISSSPTFAQARKTVTPNQPAPLLQLNVLKQKLGGSIFQRGNGGQFHSIFGGIPQLASHEDFLHQLAQYIASRSGGKNSINYAAYQKAMWQHAQMSGGSYNLKFAGIGAGNAGEMTADAFNPPPGPSGLPFNSSNFNSMGPLNYFDYGLFGAGPGQVSGRVNGVAIDPNNSKIIYIATAGGGVWKTVNGGVSWTPLSEGWPAMATASVAIDPVNPQTVYVGTGDIVFGTTPYGLMKTTDGGAHWTLEGNSTFGANTVTRILIDPANHNTILVSTGYPSNGGVYRSTDGGSTWTQVLGVSKHQYLYEDLEASDIGGKVVMYAAGCWNNDHLLQSTDEGQTWTQIYGDNNFFGVNGISVAPSQISSSTVYLMLGSTQQILEVSNSGAKVINISHELTNKSLPGGAGSAWVQEQYDYELKCNDESNQDVLYCGLDDLYRYTGKPDGNGNYWSSMLDTYTNSDTAHTDQHAFEVDPSNNSHLIIGNDGGTYSVSLSGNVDSPTLTFTSLNSALDITQFYGFDMNPTDNAWIIAGAQDNGTASSNASGPGTTNISSWTGVMDGDGAECAIDTQNPAIQYTTTPDGDVIETGNYWQDGGTDIAPFLSGNVPFVTLLTRDPNNGQDIYTSSQYLYRFNGNNWSGPLGNTQLSNNGTVSVIAVAPTNSSVIYTGSSDGELWISTNKGSSWTEIDNGNFSSISDISVSPVNPFSILACGSGNNASDPVFECTNTEAASPQWNAIVGTGQYALPGVNINTICRNPFDPNNFFYCGADFGGYYTPDNGAHWFSLNVNSNLPDAQITMMRAEEGTGKLAGLAYLTLATYGRGVWQAPLVNVLQVNGLSPNDAAVGSGATELTVQGAHFNPTDSVQWNGVSLTSKYVSANEMTATIPAVDLTAEGTYNVTVMDPTTGDISNSQQFAVGTITLQAKFGAVTKLSNGDFQAVVTLTNVGAVSASALKLVSSTLAGNSDVSSSIQNTSLSAGQSTTLTLIYPSTVKSGSQVLFIKVSYQGGGLQGGGLVTVP